MPRYPREPAYKREPDSAKTGERPPARAIALAVGVFIFSICSVGAGLRRFTGAGLRLAFRWTPASGEALAGARQGSAGAFGRLARGVFIEQPISQKTRERLAVFWRGVQRDMRPMIRVSVEVGFWFFPVTGGAIQHKAFTLYPRLARVYR